MNDSQMDLRGAQAPVPELDPEEGYVSIRKNKLNAIARRAQPLDIFPRKEALASLRELKQAGLFFFRPTTAKKGAG